MERIGVLPTMAVYGLIVLHVGHYPIFSLILFYYLYLSTIYQQGISTGYISSQVPSQLPSRDFMSDFGPIPMVTDCVTTFCALTRFVTVQATGQPCGIPRLSLWL